MERNKENEKLLSLIDEDFGIEKSSYRWYRSALHSSLVLDYEEGIFYWNSKGICGNLEDYYRKVRKVSPPKNFSPSFPQFIGTPSKEKEFAVYPKLVDAFWKMGKEHRKYWYDRLLTDGTIDRLKLGYNDGWYSVPINKNGELYNIQLRRDEPTKQVRQRYRRPITLFNSSILSSVKEVIFTEGLIDSILLNQLGFPAVSKNTGANGWSSSWIRYFTNVEKIYFLFDNDQAGRIGMKTGSEILGTFRCLGYSFEDFDKKGYDVIDFFRDGNSKEDFSLLLKRAKLVC